MSSWSLLKESWGALSKEKTLSNSLVQQKLGELEKPLEIREHHQGISPEDLKFEGEKRLAGVRGVFGRSPAEFGTRKCTQL